MSASLSKRLGGRWESWLRKRTGYTRTTKRFRTLARLTTTSATANHEHRHHGRHVHCDDGGPADGPSRRARYAGELSEGVSMIIDHKTAQALAVSHQDQLATYARRMFNRFGRGT